MSLMFAIDYDGTFTADPHFWMEFIESAKARGHACICATMRHPNEEILPEHAKLFEAVVYTSRQAKRPVVDRAGYRPSIWIDDLPFTVDAESLLRFE